jgi:TfoX N-terminal domain
MPFDEGLADRLRPLLPRRAGFTEKKMFGGIGHLWHGNMCVGVWKQSLIARVGTDQYQAALSEPHAVEFDITGRPMQGWVLIEPEGIARDDDLRAWVQRAVDFVRTLPRKG